MEPLDYHHRFHEALHHAFAARSMAVRRAYFELAEFYRRKLGERLQMHPSLELLTGLLDTAAAGRVQQSEKP